MRDYTEEDLGEGRVIKTFHNGTKLWFLNGKLHREDGPAIEYASGDKYWYLNDKFHREDGPAIEYADGGKQWWLFDRKYNSLPSPEEIVVLKREKIIKGILF